MGERGIGRPLLRRLGQFLFLLSSSFPVEVVLVPGHLFCLTRTANGNRVNRPLLGQLPFRRRDFHVERAAGDTDHREFDIGSEMACL